MLTTYKECRDAIIEAYFKNEIKPYCPDFCFCGTLSPAEETPNGMFKLWNYPAVADYSKHFFTKSDYMKMEEALLIALGNKRTSYGDFYWETMAGASPHDDDYEKQLFQGMSNALDVMRDIFIERGLPIEDEYAVFVKRELA